MAATIVATHERATAAERILRAAMLLFRERGYHGSSMGALARALRMEAASLYYHFRSKQEILVAILDRTLDDLLAGVARAVASADGPEARLRAAVRFHVLFHTDSQHQAPAERDRADRVHGRGRAADHGARPDRAQRRIRPPVQLRYPARGGTPVTDVERVARDVVIANRILANEGVVDAYGHVSVRHPSDPTRFLLSRSLAPALVERGDILELDLEGRVIGGDARPPYLERFIHGAIYEARPEVQAVVHAHAEAVLPYTISATPLRPVVHMASFIGARIPVWDIRDQFGDTNLLVVNMAQGRDLARGLGAERVVLMRGHGFSAAGRSLPEAIRIAVYLPLNARVLSEALRLGEVKALSRGEIEAHASMRPDEPSMWRAWEYWAVRAGCRDLLSART